MNKSQKRTSFLERIANILTSREIYDTIKYGDSSESKIKTFIYPHLLRELILHYKDRFPAVSERTAIKNAKSRLLWEGNKQTTINNMVLFGVQHRPDMVIEGEGVPNIAIEIKKGDNGSAVREGLGQSLVYSTLYDFTIFLFIDTSKDKRILNSINSWKEKKMINDLWENFNIMMRVV